MLPGKYVLPLVAPEDMDMQPPKGVLFVTLVAATDVRARATRPGGFAPYCCFFSLAIMFAATGVVARLAFSRSLAHACKAGNKQPSAACSQTVCFIN